MGSDEQNKKRPDPRRAKMVKMLRSGKTQEEVGMAFRVTRQRVQQIVGSGVSIDVRAHRRALLEREHGDEIERLFFELRDDAAIAERLGIPRARVTAIVEARIPDASVLRLDRRESRQRYSDAEITDSLRAAAAEVEGPLSMNNYAKWSVGRTLPDGRVVPGYQVPALRFGSWREGLAAAGLEAHEPLRAYERAFQFPDAVLAVARAWKETGKPPTGPIYERWQRGRAGYPSRATVQKLTGEWRRVLQAAWKVVHRGELPEVQPKPVSDLGNQVAEGKTGPGRPDAPPPPAAGR